MIRQPPRPTLTATPFASPTVFHSADRAVQERVLAAIFTVPHDRVSDCRHMHAKLVRASGIGLQFDPAGAVSGALYNAVARACGKPFLLVHMHFFSSGARLLGKIGRAHV